MSETFIVQVMPVWAREDTVSALTGIPQLVIRRLFNEGHVRARKMVPGKAKSAVVFRMDDVLEWLEKDAGEPALYKLPEAANG